MRAWTESFHFNLLGLTPHNVAASLPAQPHQGPHLQMSSTASKLTHVDCLLCLLSHPTVYFELLVSGGLRGGIVTLLSSLFHFVSGLHRGIYSKKVSLFQSCFRFSFAGLWQASLSYLFAGGGGCVCGKYSRAKLVFFLTFFTLSLAAYWQAFWWLCLWLLWQIPFSGGEECL